jgi:3-oxoacyl-[acyl-carrier protein] reductase
MPNPPPFSLAGLTVLVTGASSGIGRAIGVAAAASGADVALTFAHDEAGCRETAATIRRSGRRVTVAQLDLADGAQLEHGLHQLSDAVDRDLGKIDVWINNAGADILTGSSADLPAAAKLDLLLAVDLRGTIVASWHAARTLEAQPRGGLIINMSWDHVLTGMGGRNPQMFAAVKGGVLAFSKSLARSVAPKVRVNVLAPGWIATAFATELDETHRQSVAATTPLGRWGTPDDVAAAAVYLASPAAAFLTGQTIFVNGGVVMG